MRTAHRHALTLAAATATTASAFGQIRITEFMYTGNGPEFIELTNAGSAPIDLAGWSIDDSRRLPGGFPLAPLGVLSPGESAIVTEGQADAFRTDWQLSASIWVLGGLGSSGGNNLGRSDEINAYDASGSLVDRITFGDEVFGGSIRARNASGWCSRAALGVNDIYGWRLSAIGDAQGSWTSAAGDRGSPGVHALSDSAITPPPTFSHAAGRHEAAFALSLHPTAGAATIHYTLDGSVPTAASPAFTAPIAVQSRVGEPNTISTIRSCPPEAWLAPTSEVFKITTVRAVAIRPGADPSPVVTRSFLVGPGIGQRYTLPVVSVVTDPDNLFDRDIGIYVPGRIYDEQADPATQAPHARPANYTQEGEVWERPAHIEFFEQDGGVAFSQGVGIRIHGGVSTTFQQKSLRVYARSEHGPSWIDYPIFGDAAPSRHKRLILRNAGNDHDRALCRDDVLHGLVAASGVDTQASRHVIVFVNGEYWGLHQVRERYDKYYFETTHGADPENVDFLESYGLLTTSVKEGDTLHYTEMISFIRANDMTLDSNLALLESRMDVDDFIGCFAAQIYAANYDWPSNNIEYWRPRVPGGRWKWLLKDADLGMGWGPPSTPAATSIARLLGIGDWSTELFRAVVASDDGRSRFLSRLADMLNSTLREDRAVASISRYGALLSPEIVGHAARWNRPPTSAHWQSSMAALTDFASRRPPLLRADAVNAFSLPGTWTLMVRTDGANGSPRVNSLRLDRSAAAWSGVYFRSVPVIVAGDPDPGYCTRVVVEGMGEFLGQATLLPDASVSVTVEFVRSADVNLDGGHDGTDVSFFFERWEQGQADADFNDDGGVDFADVELFFQRWENAC
jgi:hypothetical protein